LAVVLTRSFRKRLRSKDSRLAAAILECVDRIEEDPRRPGLQVHQMGGKPGIWEAYVDVGNRVTFHYDDNGDVVFRNHCNHDILRNP
jgi:hypothetical protein